MKLLVDVNSKRICRSLYDDHAARIPDFVLSEKVTLELALVRPVSRVWDSRIFTPIDPTNWTLRAALGALREPVGGTFEVSYEGDESPILVPAAGTTAADLDRSINAIAGIVTAGGVIVTGGDGFFVITFNEVGARSELMADATQAIPSLLLDFTRLIEGDIDNQCIQTLRIEQNIASLGDIDTLAETVFDFAVSDAANLFTTVAHGLAVGDVLNFVPKDESTPLSGGINPGLNHFVIASGLTADTFRVSTTIGGSTIDVTADGVGKWFHSVIERVVAGDTNNSEKVRVNLPSDRWGGEYTLRIAGVETDMIGFDDGAAEIQTTLENTVGENNVLVTQDGDDSFLIQFRNALRNQSIAVTGDPRTLKVIQYKTGTLDLQNAQVQFLLEPGETDAAVIFELEVTDPADNTDKVQSDVNLRWPVVKLDSVVAPFPASNYYTTDQIDALLAGISAGGEPHATEEFTATANQTTYPLAQTVSGTPIVFIRGLLQANSDFTVTGGNTVELVTGADVQAGDIVLIFYFY